MGWTYKLHGGTAAGLSAVLLMLAALTWLPGTLPLTGSPWPLVVIFLLLFPIFAGALLRLILAGPEKHLLRLAFRCLPGKVQAALGVLVVSGVVLAVLGMGSAGSLQSPEIRDGRYYVLDTTPYARGEIEVSYSQYIAVVESDQRMMYVIPGLLFAAAALLAFTAGELRRADNGLRSSQPTGFDHTGPSHSP